MSNKIIVDYSNLGDTELANQAKSGIKGLTNNAKFSLVTELVDEVAAETIFSTELASIATGNKVNITNKNNARVVLLSNTNTLCSEVNVQAKGDLAVLQTTGFPLTKTPTAMVMGEVINFQVKRGDIAGTIDLTVDRPTYADNGTVFAYWDPTNGVAPADVNHWFQRHSNGHSLSITNLVIGKIYQFCSAYKGNDAEALIWSAIVSKMVGD